MPRHDITGFILAGGRSRRMGQDKSQLPWGRLTFLEHAINRIQKVCDPVFVVGGATGAHVPVLNDAILESGPLAGLHAALLQSTTKWNLLLAIDMPLVSAALLEFIASHCDTSSLAVVPKISVLERDLQESDATHESTDKVLQPLCAVYSREFLPNVERALSDRELSIRRLLERSAQGMMNGPSQAIRIIDEECLAAAGFSPEMLMNVNTPADLERARALDRDFNVK